MTTKPSKASRPQTKAQPARKASVPSIENLDLDPDAWPKFEALVKSAAKMGHKPHTDKKGKSREEG